jgi:superfamily I DNA and/or RNA helicase
MALQDIAANTDFVDELSKLVKEGEPAIGVICMYGEQSRLLRKRFNEIVWRDSFKSLVKIDTVDSYQGKENRIVIVSITRNDVELSPGFLRSPNRINVALSRAMDRLIIVGAADMWRMKNSTLPLGRVLSFIENEANQTDFRIINAKTNQVSKGVR